MRTRMLTLVLCGLLFTSSAGRAAPAPADGDDAKVAEYVKALKAKTAAVRKQVAVALGELGEKAKTAVPALREALLDADEGVQAAAAAALEKISGGAKVAVDAAAVEQSDVDTLRAAGLSDADVTDVVLAVGARAFFATVLDGLGARLDPQTAASFEPDVLQSMVVGRPVGEA